MNGLFHCETIAQFKIMSWLAVEGVTTDDISRVELLSADKVRIINPAGQYMDIQWTGSKAVVV